MKLINGKKIAEQILLGLKKLIQEKGIKPSLAVILVGHGPSSDLYVKQKEKAALKIGIRIKKRAFKANVSEKEILELIDSLNKDSNINGILIQIPLPQGISPDRIVESIDPRKDVDGFLKESQFEPPFIQAISKAIEQTQENLKDKNIIALVNSEVFGQSVVHYLGKRGFRVEFVLFNSPEAQAKIKQADVLITALGKPNFIQYQMIKKDVILIDGGISKKQDQIKGDIDEQSVKDKAKWLSPVPGGLGPLTVAFLLKNVVLATKK